MTTTTKPNRSIAGIDWTAPAVDIVDELVDRYLDGVDDPTPAQFESANAYADRMFVRYAK